MSSAADKGAPGEIAGLTEHLFRHESGKLVSVLTGLFGIERLQLAEDVVQEALVRALQTWPYYGVPKNPAAWLTQTAKNLALDVIRREQRFTEKTPQITAFLEQWADECNPADSPLFENEIRDARLRLLFACCHPVLPSEAQTALALKTLCGFSPAEIARAYLTTEAAVAKRLTRARQRIQEMRIPFEIPVGEALLPRLQGVWQTIYLVFNEGYKASAGDHLIRRDLCDEAIRLGTQLSEHPLGNRPATHGLLALMLFNAARFEARQDAAGNLLRLKEQDRASWDKARIARGMWHLARSAAGAELSSYQLQAAIAACHCAAPDYASTDWPKILALYDRLLALEDSPVIALNRAVALAQVHGPAAALAAVETMKNRDSLERYYLLYAVLGELTWQLGRRTEAMDYLRKAFHLTELESERAFIGRRLEECR